MKALVNDALRRGLRIGGARPSGARFRVEPHPFGVKPRIDLNRVKQLVDELEVEEITSARGWPSRP